MRQMLPTDNHKYGVGSNRGRTPTFLPAGRRLRLRNLAPRHDLTTVIAPAFDHRTRMLPFTGRNTRRQNFAL
jgi:hypothetical protein